MCCRFRLNLDKYDSKESSRVKELIKTEYPDFNLDKKEFYPGDECFVFVYENNKLVLKKMRFGSKDYFKKQILNARRETILKNMFKDDYKNNKCIVIASEFYEWDKNHSPHLFDNENNLLYLEAFYHKNQLGEYEFIIITKEAGEVIKIVHPRSPLILKLNELKPYLTNQLDITKFKDSVSLTIDR